MKCPLCYQESEFVPLSGPELRRREQLIFLLLEAYKVLAEGCPDHPAFRGCGGPGEPGYCDGCTRIMRCREIVESIEGGTRG